MLARAVKMLHRPEIISQMKVSIAPHTTAAAHPNPKPEQSAAHQPP